MSNPEWIKENAAAFAAQAEGHKRHGHPLADSWAIENADTIEERRSWIEADGPPLADLQTKKLTRVEDADDEFLKPSTRSSHTTTIATGDMRARP